MPKKVGFDQIFERLRDTLYCGLQLRRCSSGTDGLHPSQSRMKRRLHDKLIGDRYFRRTVACLSAHVE